MKTAALITIHGMGRTDPDYADGLRTDLMIRLGARSRRLYFDSVYYQDILQVNQQRVWKAAKAHGLRWTRLRKFLLYGFGDAAALESYKLGVGREYTTAQVRIAKALYNASQVLGGDGPVVLIAHSLGGQVVTNYLWDAQHPGKRGFWENPDTHAAVVTNHTTPHLSCGDRAFLGGSTIHCLYTTGCNIPIFVAGHGTIKAIAPRAAGFEWHNFYDADDVLGWPLRCLSDEYKRLVTDHRVNVSGGTLNWLGKSWNPLSHGLYWQDESVLHHLVSRLGQFL